MTDQEAELCQALLIWAKALDAAAEAVQARINATLEPDRPEFREERNRVAANGPRPVSDALADASA
jgi:hypothetical protein